MSYDNIRKVIKNSVEEHIGQAVVQMAMDNLALGQIRVSNELRKESILVSPGGVRSIWLRHDMETLPEASEGIVCQSGTGSHNP